MPGKETGILNSICEYLAYRSKSQGYIFWRNNVIPVFSAKNNAFIRMPKYSRTGLPDIIVIKDGFFIGLEVKQLKGKQSPNQKEFEKDLKEAGGEYHVVHSIDEVKVIGL